MAEINDVNERLCHVQACGNQIQNSTHTNTHIDIYSYENITCLMMKKLSLKT